MKYATANFSLEQSHELKVCGTSKFTGITLEVLLDGRSLFVESNCKKYHVFEVPVEDTAITLYVKMTSKGEPEIALFRDGVSMVDDQPYEEFLAAAEDGCKKESRLTILRNLLLTFLFFAAVVFLVKWFRADFKTEAAILKDCGAWALMLGGAVALLFMIFDIVEGSTNLKSLRRSGEKPTSLATEEEDEILEELDEEIDPDSIVVPDDAPNYFEQLSEEEEAALEEYMEAAMNEDAEDAEANETDGETIAE